ncbi:MAG: flagellar hook-associated protein FlgK [candidate division Zixibacteria bacterium CG_4_9_14_3_um_filter_46_8]|nr:MAG: flagellar hook-associated protein FlgK [candidate division Zixibacteria bacterium CG_4_9_14_3_um_filter_46_8]
MYGINVGFEIARRALLAQQYGMNVAGHNIANISTPGYTRQDVNFEATEPMKILAGYGGTGVEVAAMRRIRSLFLDTQMYKENQGLGQWQSLDQTWNQVEMIFSEPSDTGLSQMMSDFWNAWEDLGDSTEELAAKNSVKEKASSVINGFHQIIGQLKDLRRSLDTEIGQTVGEINGYIHQIAQLNGSIAQMEAGGQQANDLRDQRGYLTEQLSKIMNIQEVEQSDGTISLSVGSVSLVNQSNYNDLGTEVSHLSGDPITKVVLSSNSMEINVKGGSLKGMLEARDEIIPEKMAELDAFAAQLVQSINSVHSAGYTTDGLTGIDFFDPEGTTAETISLSFEIEEDANNIAISQNGTPGDNSNVLAILDLRDQYLMNGNSATFGDYYNSVIGEIGSRAQEASNLSSNHQLLVNQIEYRRQAVSGVSLDEEMANMISYEHAYGAAAKLMNVMDTAMETIINML